MNLNRQLPQWYDDCKLGIFVHWGLYSVPAFAETFLEFGDYLGEHYWFTHNCYAEWYLNTIRIKSSPAYEYHVKKYGKNFKYEQFADMFLAEKFDSQEWAQLFKDSGASYVVLTTKHHDGFCLYNSKYTSYNSVAKGPNRDILQELSQAVRAKGLKMGAYFSGLLDWTYVKEPHVKGRAKEHYCRTKEFADYSYNQITEIIENYKPSVLWNDIGWPEAGKEKIPEIFSHYYNTVPDGVINDRFWAPHCDFMTAEYKTGDRPLDKKWEMCRGLGKSFGYNQMENENIVMSTGQLISQLCYCASRGGNLLINIGPDASGTIPEIQKDRLLGLGNWLKHNGEAIYKTKCRQECQSEKIGNVTIYYTQKDDIIYAVFDGLSQGENKIILQSINLKNKKINAIWGADVSCEENFLIIKTKEELPVSVKIY